MPSYRAQLQSYLEEMYKQQRERADWQLPEDTPARYTNKLDPDQKPGDFVELGGQAVVRPIEQAYEYAAVEYERPDRRRLSYWTDASYNPPYLQSVNPARRQWGWHGTAVVGREDFCATGSLDWTHDSGLYRPRRQRSDLMEFRALDQAFGRCKQKLQQDQAAHGCRRGWDTFAAFTDCLGNLTAITTFRRDNPEHMAKPFAPAVLAILAKLQFLVLHGVDVQLHWVSAHSGIEGNELADAKARGAAEFGRRWWAADRSRAWIRSRADGSEPTAVLLE